MTAPTTDKRLDDLREEMHRGFDRVDREIGEARSEVKYLRTETREGFAAVDARFFAMEAKSDAKFDALNRTIIYILGGAVSTLVAGAISIVIALLF